MRKFPKSLQELEARKVAEEEAAERAAKLEAQVGYHTHCNQVCSQQITMLCRLHSWVVEACWLSLCNIVLFPLLSTIYLACLLTEVEDCKMHIFTPSNWDKTQERQLQKELEEAQKIEKLAEERKQQEQEQQDKVVGCMQLLCARHVCFCWLGRLLGVWRQ